MEEKGFCIAYLSIDTVYDQRIFERPFTELEVSERYLYLLFYSMLYKQSKQFVDKADKAY